MSYGDLNIEGSVEIRFDGQTLSSISLSVSGFPHVCVQWQCRDQGAGPARPFPCTPVICAAPLPPAQSGAGGAGAHWCRSSSGAHSGEEAALVPTLVKITASGLERADQNEDFSSPCKKHLTKLHPTLENNFPFN